MLVRLDAIILGDCWHARLRKLAKFSEDLFDTLKLLGTGRHPALPAEKQFVPSPHVARGLAGCGREDAIEVLCDTIATDRYNAETVTPGRSSSRFSGGGGCQPTTHSLSPGA